MTDAISFMNAAKAVSAMSPCSNKCGAVIIKNGSIISMGYNGYELTETDKENNCEIHAEIHAALMANKNEIPIDSTTMYVYGTTPCNNCAIFLINAGIREVVYFATNLPSESVKKAFKKAGVLFKKIKDIKS